MCVRVAPVIGWTECALGDCIDRYDIRGPRGEDPRELILEIKGNSFDPLESMNV